MKQATNLMAIAAIAFSVIFTSCSKDDLTGPPSKPGDQGPNNPGPNNPGPNNPGNENPDSFFVLKVKAAISIGGILYDSIPASLQVTSWDSSNNAYQSQLNLTAGTNNVRLTKTHARFKLKLSKWGVTDEITLAKTEIREGRIISLGGSKTARKLRMEEGFLFAAGAYQPSGKTVYSYNANGTLRQIDYYLKKPQHSDLKLYHYDQFVYNGNTIEKINRFDENAVNVGATVFTFNGKGKIINMHQHSYGTDTYASVDYGAETGVPGITIDYLYNNGQAMEYKMKFKGGNKVEDQAISSTGGSEGGTYGYDANINPYAHINLPDIYLSNLSKNNMISQQKTYSGSIPSGVPYKFDYACDAEGYPIELTKHYKSYVTGQDLYKTKTIYTY